MAKNEGSSEVNKMLSHILATVIAAGITANVWMLWGLSERVARIEERLGSHFVIKQ